MIIHYVDKVVNDRIKRQVKINNEFEFQFEISSYYFNLIETFCKMIELKQSPRIILDGTTLKFENKTKKLIFFNQEKKIELDFEPRKVEILLTPVDELLQTKMIKNLMFK